MTTYYYELKCGCGHFQHSSDKEALDFVKNWIKSGNLMCLYKESDTDDGEPFIMLWEYK